MIVQTPDSHESSDATNSFLITSLRCHTLAISLKSGGRRQLVDLDEVATLSETEGTVGYRQSQQKENGQYIDKDRCSRIIRPLRSKDRQCLQHITDKEGFAHVPPKQPIVNLANMPQDPTTRQS